MFDLKLSLMAGTDIPVPELQGILHQPKIKEIAFIGEREFLIGIQCLSIQKSMFIKDKNAHQEITNFQIFMTVMNEKEIQDKKQNVISVLTVLFPDYKIIFTPRSIVLNTSKENKENIMIDENNFEALQGIIGQVFCLENTGQDIYNPANEQARIIAEKLMRGRQRAAQAKAAENGGNSDSIFARQLSILTIGLKSMSLQDLLDLTMYQLYDLMERYTLYLNWDLDVKSRLAGGKPEKQAEDWMKNIH